MKEAGVPHVAKASSEVHGKLLQRVGADHVVYPETRPVVRWRDRLPNQQF